MLSINCKKQYKLLFRVTGGFNICFSGYQYVLLIALFRFSATSISTIIYTTDIFDIQHVAIILIYITTCKQQSFYSIITILSVTDEKEHLHYGRVKHIFYS